MLDKYQRLVLLDFETTGLSYQKDKVIEIINKLIIMNVGTIFSFKELGISSKLLMNEICGICDELNLKLISSQNKEHDWRTINENGNFEKVYTLPASLCNIDDLIEKIK